MRYSIIRYLAVLVLPAGIVSCHKSSAPPATASLTIINAVVGADTLVTNFSGTDSLELYSSATQLLYGQYNSSYEFSGYLPMQPLALNLIQDTTAHSTPLFNLKLALPANTIHTLFLVGTASAPDTMFTTDNPPYHAAADSSMGIRFVNLSPGSGPVSVNISGLPAGSTVGNLLYKGISGFLNFAAGSANVSYVFEFHDAATGALLASYMLTSVCYRNFTIALDGLPGSQGAFIINNY